MRRMKLFLYLQTMERVVLVLSKISSPFKAQLFKIGQPLPFKIPLSVRFLKLWPTRFFCFSKTMMYNLFFAFLVKSCIVLLFYVYFSLCHSHPIQEVMYVSIQRISNKLKSPLSRPCLYKAYLYGEECIGRSSVELFAFIKSL